MKRIILLSLILTTVFNCFSQSYNNNAHVFNICMFGAKKATIVFDGVMTSSSATLTSATASFVAGDVGKIIVVKRAGTSGRDLITTIASFTNSTTVTLTASASTSVTIARVTFGIDCTTAIQNAINVANGLLGGKVYVPLGWYIVAGALQTSVGGINMNSQLYIPFTLNSSNIKNHIIIEGESAPNLSPGGGLAADITTPYAGSGSFLYSTLTSGAASCAVIGTGNDGSHANLSFLSVQNLGIVVLNNPSGIGPEAGGIEFNKGASLIAKNVYVGIDTTGYVSTYPSNNINGIETTNDGAQTFNSLQNTLCVGFRTGYKIGEHTSCDQAQAWVCFYAFQFKSGTHSFEAHRIGTYWCAYDIYVNAASGKCNLINLQFDAEWQQIGKWYDDVNTIKDSANVAKGNIFYVIVAAGAGIDNTKFSLSGGSNLFAIPYNAGLPTITQANTFQATQTFSTSIITPIVAGGTGTTSTLTLQPTTGVGTTGADIVFKNGNNGATEVGRIINTGSLRMGASAYAGSSANDKITISGTTYGYMSINGSTASSNNVIGFNQGAGDGTANNRFYSIGLNGSQSDANYGGNTLANGDFGLVTYFSGFKKVWSATAGTQNMVMWGNVGFAGQTPTAYAHFPAGVSATAPIALTAGTLIATPLSGRLETNTVNDLFYTNGTATRTQVALWGYIAKSSSYTATDADNTIEVTATGQTITLPTAVGITGRVYTIKLTASGSATVGTTGGQNIDASTTYSLSAQYKYVTVQSNGANWLIIANN